MAVWGGAGALLCGAGPGCGIIASMAGGPGMTSRRRRQAIMIAILVAGLATLLAAPASAGVADMGIYGGAGPYGAPNIQRFQAWLGHQMPRGLPFFSCHSR